MLMRRQLTWLVYLLLALLVGMLISAVALTPRLRRAPHR
jgi:hypothetical protein